jgi:hypothetical protein
MTNLNNAKPRARTEALWAEQLQLLRTFDVEHPNGRRAPGMPISGRPQLPCPVMNATGSSSSQRPASPTLPIASITPAITTNLAPRHRILVRAPAPAPAPAPRHRILLRAPAPAPAPAPQFIRPPALDRLQVPDNVNRDEEREIRRERKRHPPKTSGRYRSKPCIRCDRLGRKCEVQAGVGLACVTCALQKMKCEGTDDGAEAEAEDTMDEGPSNRPAPSRPPARNPQPAPKKTPAPSTQKTAPAPKKKPALGASQSKMDAGSKNGNLLLYFYKYLVFNSNH